jgi:DeoR family transcriptional regulator of aga operon
VVVVTDATKLGRVAFASICGLAEVGELITDSAADPEQLERLRSAGLVCTTV